MKEYALEFVCAMGVGTVFVGLICLIIICSVIGAFCRIGTKKKEVAPVAPAAPAVIENKQEILAAVSAGCPPAVPILVCGEKIDQDAAACLSYYGTTHCTVVLP